MKSMHKKLGSLPKKINKSSFSRQQLLTTALASSAALSLAGCGGGGGASDPPATSVLTLNAMNDVTVREGSVITLNPTARSSTGLGLDFFYSGFMTTRSKQTVVGDAGIHSVRVTVSDGINSRSQDIRVIVYNDVVSMPAQHLVRRITFGVTPALFHEANLLGAQGFIDQQLNPTSIDNSAFDQRIAGLPTTSRRELRSWTLTHMLYSKRQLLEVMTWFWDNHFNTDINTVTGNREIRDAQEQLERQENEAFRANALGNFRQLLGVSAKSTTMLLYLNSAQNRRSDSNENYSRELLELHTMGVNGGYTHMDIEAGAEIFTGWHVRNLAFFFNSNQHNPSAHTYLGTSIPAGGLAQGEQVLDILAAHASTAQFICSKLVTLLVSDTPPQTLIDRCAATFQATVNAPDQITQVLRIILTSAEFNAPANTLSKVKSPVEFAASIVRGLDGESTGSSLQNLIENMGLDLYEKSEPTGFSEKAADWVSASALLERLKAIENLLRVNNVNGMRTDLLAFLRANGVTTTDTIVDFFLIRLLGVYPPSARTQAVTFLNGATGFSMTDNDASTRVRHLLEIIMSYPQFQYQ